MIKMRKNIVNVIINVLIEINIKYENTYELCFNYKNFNNYN